MRRALRGAALLGVRGPGPNPPPPLPPADLSRAVSGAGRPGARSEFRGKWRWGEGLGEFLRVVVFSCWWLGGVERRG